jgi:hypothetical protein
MAQIHKKFTDEQVKELLERYLNKTIERKHVQTILGIEKVRFFALLKRYRQGPQNFSVQYHRRSKPKISASAEKNIFKELKADKKLIQNPDVPLKSYNYSFVRNRLETNHGQKVSLTTIIRRAKKHDFYLGKRKKATHDREVLTNYVGELIQHDSSHHLFAPAAGKKWYLITSLDDYSRRILYGDLFEAESSWLHIRASQTLITEFGCPFSYYVDSHSIFRFVQGRDSIWRKHHLLTDQADTQWKQVMNDCRIEVVHALSPQAKGKIERPYGWLQDHLVRTCARENISDIKQARKMLYQELHRYNYHQLHSTTGEVPYLRFQKAINKNKSLFRSFKVPPPFIDPKDIFCFRLKRTIDPYRRISIDNLQLKLNNANPREIVDLRISPLNKTIAEIRCWCNDKLICVHKLKIADLRGVHF